MTASFSRQHRKLTEVPIQETDVAGNINIMQQYEKISFGLTRGSIWCVWDEFSRKYLCGNMEDAFSIFFMLVPLKESQEHLLGSYSLTG